MQTILFLNTLKHIKQFAATLKKIGATLFSHTCTIWILTFKSLNSRTMWRIWKNNYIFGILQLRWMIWHTFKQHSSTFNFWPLYNSMGSFWNPIFQNAQWWCQLVPMSGHVKESEPAKNCNYTWLSCSRFILLFISSTISLCQRLDSR